MLSSTSALSALHALRFESGAFVVVVVVVVVLVLALALVLVIGLVFRWHVFATGSNQQR